MASRFPSTANSFHISDREMLPEIAAALQATSLEPTSDWPVWHIKRFAELGGAENDRRTRQERITELVGQDPQSFEIIVEALNQRRWLLGLFATHDGSEVISHHLEQWGARARLNLQTPTQVVRAVTDGLHLNHRFLHALSRQTAATLRTDAAFLQATTESVIDPARGWLAMAAQQIEPLRTTLGDEHQGELIATIQTARVRTAFNEIISLVTPHVGRHCDDESTELRDFVRGELYLYSDSLASEWDPTHALENGPQAADEALVNRVETAALELGLIPGNRISTVAASIYPSL